MPDLPVCVNRDRRLASDHHRGASMHPDAYLIPFDNRVGEAPRVVPGEPLLPREHETSWSDGDEIFRQDTSEGDGVTTQLGRGPLLSQPLELPTLALHRASSDAAF